MLYHHGLGLSKRVLQKRESQLGQLLLREWDHHRDVYILVHHLFVVVSQVLDCCGTSPKSSDKTLSIRSSDLHITNLTRIRVLWWLFWNNNRVDDTFVHACLNSQEKFRVVTVLLHQSKVLVRHLLVLILLNTTPERDAGS